MFERWRRRGQVLLSATTARLASGDLPPDVRLIDLGPHRLDGFDEPETVFAVDAPGLAVPPDPSRPPYRGLVPYDVDDDESFFGRDREIDICLQTAGRLGTPGGRRAVGLRQVLSRPGRDRQPAPPSRAVGRRCSAPDPIRTRRGSPRWRRPVRRLCWSSTSSRSIFAPDVASGAAQQFLDDLVNGSTSRRSSSPSAATTSARSATHPSFARRLEAGLHLVTPMTEDELRDVIERPAQRAGLRLEPGLVELLLRDVRGEPGGCRCCRSLWPRRGRTATVERSRSTATWPPVGSGRRSPCQPSDSTRGSPPTNGCWPGSSSCDW